VSASLLAFMGVYAIVFSVGALYILRLMAVGPASPVGVVAPSTDRAPANVMAAAEQPEGGG